MKETYILNMEELGSLPPPVAVVGVAAWGPANLPSIIISDEPKGLIAKLRWRLRRWHLRLRYGSRVKTWTEAYGDWRAVYGPHAALQPGFLERAFKEGYIGVVQVPGEVEPCSVCGSKDYNGFSTTWRDGKQVVIGRCCGGCG